MSVKTCWKAILIAAFGLLAVLDSKGQQPNEYVITIVQQPGSPIEILEGGIAPIDPPPLLPWIQYKNRSKVPIVEYTLMAIITTAKGNVMTAAWEVKGPHAEPTDAPLEELTLAPGQVKTVDRRTPEQIEPLRAKIKKLSKIKPLEKSEFPIKVEFLVKRAILEDGAVFDAEKLANVLEGFYK